MWWIIAGAVALVFTWVVVGGILTKVEKLEASRDSIRRELTRIEGLTRQKPSKEYRYRMETNKEADSTGYRSPIRVTVERVQSHAYTDEYGISFPVFWGQVGSRGVSTREQAIDFIERTIREDRRERAFKEDIGEL